MDMVISLCIFGFVVLLLLAAYAISEGGDQNRKDVIAVASLFGGAAVSVVCLLLGWTIEASSRSE